MIHRFAIQWKHVFHGLKNVLDLLNYVFQLVEIALTLNRSHHGLIIIQRFFRKRYIEVGVVKVVENNGFQKEQGGVHIQSLYPTGLKLATFHAFWYVNVLHHIAVLIRLIIFHQRIFLEWISKTAWLVNYWRWVKLFVKWSHQWFFTFVGLKDLGDVFDWTMWDLFVGSTVAFGFTVGRCWRRFAADKALVYWRWTGDLMLSWAFNVLRGFVQFGADKVNCFWINLLMVVVHQDGFFLSFLVHSITWLSRVVVSVMILLKPCSLHDFFIFLGWNIVRVFV